MYNLRAFSFPNSNSKEYRMYKIGVVEDRGPFGVERKKWHNELDEKGNRVSFDDEGNYRSQEDTDRCFYESRKRSKNMILEYARANNWEWFITLTFNPDMVDSYNYDLCYKRVSKYFNNLRSRKCPNLKYLLVPEQHPTSGRWHFHGLISNVDEFSLGITKYKGCIYHIDGFKYGFTTATKVKDTIMILHTNLKKSLTYKTPLSLEFETEISTRIDPSEIISSREKLSMFVNWQ